jgi:hypothetical protein
MTWTRILLALWPCISSTSYAFVLHNPRIPGTPVAQFQCAAHMQNQNAINGPSRRRATSITMNMHQDSGTRKIRDILPQIKAATNQNHAKTHDHHHHIMEASNAVKKTVEKCLLRSLTGELGGVGALVAVLLILDGEVSLDSHHVIVCNPW